MKPSAIARSPCRSSFRADTGLCRNSPTPNLSNCPSFTGFKPENHRKVKRWDVKKVAAGRSILKSFASQLPPEWIALLREDNPTRYYDGLTGWRGRVPRLPTYSVKRLAPEDLRLLKRCAKLIVQDGDTAQEAVITDWLLLRTLRMGRGAGYIHNELCTYMEQSRQTAAPGADANSYISTFESDGTASAVSGDARMVERYSETSSQGTSAQMIF